MSMFVLVLVSVPITQLWEQPTVGITLSCGVQC